MKQRSTALLRIGRLAAALAAMLFLATGPSGAQAYVLTGPHILELTAEAMGPITSLAVDEKLLIYPPLQESPATVLDETALYVMPLRFRSDIAADQVQRTHLVFGNQAVTVVDGRLTYGEDLFDRYQRILRSRTRSQLMHTLNRLGIETALSSLGRVDSRVVYVVGAHYPDETVSQLAVDKETFLPLRLLLVDGDPTAGGMRLGIFYNAWRKVQKGYFPHQVTFFANGRLVREIRVTSLQSNPAIDPQRLDIEALVASIRQQADGDASQAQKHEAVEAVQQAVQNFQKKFE